jgi:YD repeat-containing protein
MTKNLGIAVALMCAMVIQIVPLNAQNLAKQYPKVTMMSVNAAALGKYIEYPVNAHTGVPDINIPLHTVTEGSLSLPVSLSYHAGGIKVAETASWVGLGWSLNAGGAVSRTVRGIPDEKRGFDGGFSYYSDFGFSNFFMKTDAPSVIDYNAFINGSKDPEADLFFFNFLGQSGTFMFREDQKPVLFPDADFKIEPVFKDSYNNYGEWDFIQGFVITATDGTRYHFGVTPSTTDVDPIEKGGSQRGDDLVTFDTYISSWFLYKIESADRLSKIDLTYRSEKYAYYNIATGSCAPSCGTSTSLVKSYVTGVTPSEILASNEKVSFIPATTLREDLCSGVFNFSEQPNLEARALAEVKIESTRSTFCKTYKFSTTYFTASESGTLPTHINNYGPFTSDKKRLKLNLIQEFSCSDNSVNKPPHVFLYNETYPLPRRLSLAQDHWGFYNGAHSNSTMIPVTSKRNDFSLPTNDGNDNRESNAIYMQSGILKSIQYPTGGGMEFLYTSNSVVAKDCAGTTKSPNSFATVQAGMLTANSEFGPSYTLTVSTPGIYYYSFVSTPGPANSVHGWGDLYVDGSVIASVSNQGTVSGTVYLNAGTHVFKCFANADSGQSGCGVYANLYGSILTCVDADRTVGGLRISEISKFGAPSGSQWVKKFEYSNGTLYSIPTYIMKYRNPVLGTGIIANTVPNGCRMDGTLFETISSAESSFPLQTTQGSHIGYGSVKEKLPDGGYTISEFNAPVILPPGWISMEEVSVRKIDASVCSLQDPEFPGKPVPYDFSRGKLKSKSIYDKNNVKLQESTFSETFVYDNTGIFGIKIGTHYSSGSAVPLIVHYETRSGRITSQQQVEKLFDPLDPTQFIQTTTTSEYSSAHHRMITKVNVVDSEDQREIRYRYVPDLTGCDLECPSCATDFQAAALAAKNTYESNRAGCTAGYLNCSTFVGCDLNYNPCSDPEDCKLCAWTDYQYRLNLLRKTYTTCLINCNSGTPCSTAGLNSSYADVKTLHEMEKYNLIMSPVEASSFKNGNLLNSTYFHSTTVPLSNPPKIYLKDIWTLNLSVPSSTFTPSTTGSSGFTKDPRYSALPEISYVYDAGQMVETRDVSGVVSSYIWGYNNTVPVVKAVGVDYNTLKAAYTADPANVRTHPSMINAQITTYTADPVKGLLTATDPGGKTQTYDYDLLGRLFRIKDHNGKIVEQYEYKYQYQ